MEPFRNEVAAGVDRVVYLVGLGFLEPTNGGLSGPWGTEGL